MIGQLRRSAFGAVVLITNRYLTGVSTKPSFSAA